MRGGLKSEALVLPIMVLKAEEFGGDSAVAHEQIDVRESVHRFLLLRRSACGVVLKRRSTLR